MRHTSQDQRLRNTFPTCTAFLHTAYVLVDCYLLSCAEHRRRRFQNESFGLDSRRSDLLNTCL